MPQDHKDQQEIPVAKEQLDSQALWVRWVERDQMAPQDSQVPQDPQAPLGVQATLVLMEPPDP